MKKPILLLVLTLLISFNSYSQIIFEKGYFIDPNNKKTDCLIENIDWKNNPINFRYKLSENENILNADIKNVKEFGIDRQSKFIRAAVKIDRSGKKIENLTLDKNPVFNEETLFLKVVIEGKASLYLYDDGNLRRLFYKIDNSEIKQLVYKSYLVTNYSMAKNNYFREQLFIDLKCDNISQKEYENLNYTKTDLEKFFVKYNKCNDVNFTELDKKEKKDLFNLNIRPRFNSSSLSINGSFSNDRDFEFDANSNFSLGVEAEFIMPFNKNKWALIIEPTYQYYKSEKSKENANYIGGEIIGKVDYKSIELPVGIRHYFFFKNGFKLFVNASAIFDFSSDSKLEFTRKDNSQLSALSIKSGTSLGLGVGGKFKDRYSIELRYQTGRGILKDYPAWSSSFKSISLIAGYSFF